VLLLIARVGGARVLGGLRCGRPDVLDEQASVTWRDGIPDVSKSWSRGQINEIESGRAVGFTEQGEFGQV
jgi:hypothetical protein